MLALDLQLAHALRAGAPRPGPESIPRPDTDPAQDVGRGGAAVLRDPQAAAYNSLWAKRRGGDPVAAPGARDSAPPPIWTINPLLERHGLVDTLPYTPPGHALPRGSPAAAQRPPPTGLREPPLPPGRQAGLWHPPHRRLQQRRGAGGGAEEAGYGGRRGGRGHLATATDPPAPPAEERPILPGSNRSPRSFGLLIRLCLSLEVELLCIQDGEPWRDGIVERFNDVYDPLCFRSQRFRHLANLAHELPRFETFHKTQHRYAKLGQHAPWEIHAAARHRRLPSEFARHRRGLLFREGPVSFVCLTDDQGRVCFSSEEFLMDSSLVHEYVTGTAFTRTGLLKFSYQRHVIKIYMSRVTKP